MSELGDFDQNGGLSQEFLRRLGDLMEGTSIADKPAAVLPDGRVEATQMAQLLNEQPSLDLKTLGAGDVMWWRDESGNTGYFRVMEPINSEVTNRVAGQVQGIDYKNRPLSSPMVWINGATLGGMLALDRVALNLGIEFSAPSSKSIAGLRDSTPDSEIPDFLPKRYQSGVVKDVGVIKADRIGTASPKPQG